MKRLALCLVLLLSLPLVASNSHDWKSGTLIDVTDSRSQRVIANTVTHASSSVTDVEYRLSVTLEKLTYVGSYWPQFSWSYAPHDLVVNEPIKVRINGAHMFLLLPNGKELKTKIVKRVAIKD